MSDQRCMLDKENLQKITELRHELHRHPELSMCEKETSGMIRRFLQKNTDLKIVDRGCWFYAVKEGKNRDRKMAFRADMDALPVEEDTFVPYHSLNAGVSHKCGHDGHSAALCGLALELNRLVPEKTVYLIFQPGEETGQGALYCRKLIAEEGISEIYAFHNLPGYQEKTVVYRPGLTQPSSEGLKISFHGKTSHASAPEEGCNPAGIISRVILYAEKMSGKRSGGMVLCTVTGIRLGSGDFGISPGDGDLFLTLRAEHEEELHGFEHDIRTFAAKEAEAAGIRAECSIHDYFPETRNDASCLEKILRAALDTGIPTAQMHDLWRASEDFGWYLKECPGAMIYIGSGGNAPALHTAAYDFNDGILETAADLFTALAVNSGTEKH